MPAKTVGYQKFYLAFVIIFSLAGVVFLSCATYYINYRPTDSENPYIPVARQFFKLPYPSAMHEIPVAGMLKLTMHAKETLIAGIALFQKLLNDSETLYPNVLLLILATGLSGVLIYSIMKKIFNPHIGLLAFFLFATSFWSCLYILQGAHP